MSTSRSNSKARVPVHKDAKPKPSQSGTSTNKATPKHGPSSVPSKPAVKSQTSKIPAAAPSPAKKDQIKKPAAPPRAISKDRAPVRATSKDRAPVNDATSRPSRPTQPTKTNIVTPTRKVPESKLTKSVTTKTGTTPTKTGTMPTKAATKPTSKPGTINGGSKVSSKSETIIKNGKSSEKPINLSGSRTATKEKPSKALESQTPPPVSKTTTDSKSDEPGKSDDSSEENKRPSTVNLSSRRGENLVLRNPESIIANNETVLNSASSSTPLTTTTTTAELNDALDAEIDYEDDFEDYESDFEPDDEEEEEEDSAMYDESSKSEVSFSEPSHSYSESAKVVQNTSASPPQINASSSKDYAVALNAKPMSLSLYENQHASASSYATPMTPITVTPMTPSVPMTPATPSTMLFNFAQAEQSITKMKTQSRAMQLLELITLDKQTFNIYDSPPANYETFIQVFGNSNRKQVYTQTDVSEDQVTQTDEIDALDKWTQNPPEGLQAVGGDLISEDMEDWKLQVNGVRLHNFINNASHLILKILDEETTEVIQNRLSKCDMNVPFSSGYFEVNMQDAVVNQPVNEICFSEGQPSYLLSVHGTTKNSSDESLCNICIWDLKNPSRPEYILNSKSLASKCVFNPGDPILVFAGMFDGSILLWDLREPNSQHRKLTLTSGETVTYRTATYSTAAVQWETGHHSAIVNLQTFTYQNSSTTMQNLYDNRFCNLLTLEDLGILNTWTVVEISNPDISGSEIDLGLAPGGRLKLLKIQAIVISDIVSPNPAAAIALRSLSFRIEPSNPHNLFVTTDTGVVLHCTRQGHLSIPRLYEFDGANKEVRCLAFNPHRLPYFVTGCNDGNVYVHHTKNSKPILSCLFKPASILNIQWSIIRPTVFYVLDSESRIQIWDLSVSSTAPCYVGEFQGDRITQFCVVLDRTVQSHWSQYIVASTGTGMIRVYKLVDKLIKVTTDEYDLLRNLMNDL